MTLYEILGLLFGILLVYEIWKEIKTGQSDFYVGKGR